MMYKCTIAYAGKPDDVKIVFIEAENKGQALVENSKANPKSYVKIIEEVK